MRVGRYFATQMVTAMVIVVVSLTCVIWLSQSLRFIDLIVNRGLPLFTFLQLTFMLMPTFLAIVLPIACFAAVLFTYNKMANDRELVVLSAAGVSPLGLARPAILVGVATTALCYLMTLYLIPLSYRGFKELQFQIRHSYSDVLLREGVFNSLGDKITVYIHKRSQSGGLEEIIVHDDRDADEAVTLVAEQGALVLTPEGPKVRMVNGNRQARDRKTGTITLLYFDKYTVDIGNLGAVDPRVFRDMNELFLLDLLYPTESVTAPRNFNEFRAEGHSRLTMPFLALALTLVGLAVVLRGEFSRRGQSKRLAIAIVLAGMLEAGGLGSKLIAAKEPVTIPLMYLAILLPIAGALVALARQRLRRPTGASAPAAA